ncbi:hydrolase [Clostridium sp. AL.422]|uniref:glycoside hydrolase family 113 n=1 Tax=Clostridium TaxID=1485 RepID=UPI00293DE7CF|nr:MULTISPECIES: hydrolase [unclassified Clostridium]MDV4149902.1 hydrolase [Clostridium sp. AL.422]
MSSNKGLNDEKKDDLRVRTIAGLIIVFIAVGYYFYRINYNSRGIINKVLNKIEGKTLNSEFSSKIKSANLSTDYSVEQAIQDIETLELNTINLPVVINIEDITSSDVSIDNNSLQRAKILLKELKGNKINVILEPYPWIANGSKYETDFNPINKSDFLLNWQDNVIKPLIDEIAIPYRVDALNIATGFTHLEDMEDEFCEIIDFARKYYKGLITYRTSFWTTANWKDEVTKNQVEELNEKYNKKLNNKIFSKVDFISIASYFELTDNDTNTIENLVSSLSSSQRYNREQNIKEQVENFHYKWEKPIFFGELGFPRTTKASVEPWNPYLSKDINTQEQANCFEAYRRVYESEPWFLGFSIFAVGNKEDDKMYYPSEETIEVISNWFNSENN